jgi:hypothetical protein
MTEPDFNINDADRRTHALARLRIVCRYSLFGLIVLVAGLGYAGTSCGITSDYEIKQRVNTAHASGYNMGVADECRRRTPTP